MRFHWGSFLLGYGAGLSSAYLAKQFRPVLLEIATAVYQLIDSAAANVAQKREDVEDILAEARARARGGSEARRAQGPTPLRRRRANGRARARA